MTSIYSLAWSPNGRWLVASGNAQQIQIWDIQQSTVVKTLPTTHPEIRSVCWSPDSRWLACGQGYWKNTQQGQVQVWLADTGELWWSADEQLFGAYAVRFAPHGRWLASGHGSGVVNIWDTLSKKLHRTFDTAEHITKLVNGLDFSPNSQLLAFGTCYEDEVQVVKLDGQLVQEHHHPGCDTWADFEHPIRFSPNGWWFARGIHNGQIKLWNTTDFQLSANLYREQGPVYALDWHPNSRYLASGTMEGEISIWDMASRNPIKVFAHRLVHSLSFSPDGGRLATGGDGPNIYIWDTAVHSDSFGQIIQTLKH